MARSRPNRGNAAAPKQPTTTTTTTTTSTTEQQQQQPSKDDLRAAANLVSLRRTDPAVTAIVDSTSQVALYRYSSTSKGWAKEGAEGAMFLVRRDPTTQSHITNKPIGGPRFALAILNRVATHNWTLPLTRDLAFAPNGDYWMFQSKRDTATSFGIWFLLFSIFFKCR
ncbi:hypothetical protein BC828DRAFT_394168 [Blastocladiella britannica]|nr:hypothetical protein BC828DRAFT_394168 [Blastocladiella britannica]